MKLPLKDVVAATGGRLIDATAAPADVIVSTDTRACSRAKRSWRCGGRRSTATNSLRPQSNAAPEWSSSKAPIRSLPELRRCWSTTRVLRIWRWRRWRAVVSKGRLSALPAARERRRPAPSSCNYSLRGTARASHRRRAMKTTRSVSSKLLLGLDPAEHDVAVVEMGARHPGDIATLVNAATPDVGILTNVGDAHVEIMGSRERLAETKWALFSRGARAILNARDDVSLSRASTLRHEPHWFAAYDSSETIRMPGHVTAIVNGNRLIDGGGGAAVDLHVSLDIPGQHNRANAAAAAACAIELGVDARDVGNALGELQMPAGRFETFEMGGGWRLIFDAYNASAGGTIAALDALDDQHARRAIAVLASMAELGDESHAVARTGRGTRRETGGRGRRHRRLCRRAGARRENRRRRCRARRFERRRRALAA